MTYSKNLVTPNISPQLFILHSLTVRYFPQKGLECNWQSPCVRGGCLLRRVIRYARCQLLVRTPKECGVLEFGASLRNNRFLQGFLFKRKPKRLALTFTYGASVREAPRVWLLTGFCEVFNGWFSLWKTVGWLNFGECFNVGFFNFFCQTQNCWIKRRNPKNVCWRNAWLWIHDNAVRNGCKYFDRKPNPIQRRIGVNCGFSLCLGFRFSVSQRKTLGKLALFLIHFPFFLAVLFFWLFGFVCVNVWQIEAVRRT